MSIKNILFFSLFAMIALSSCDKEDESCRADILDKFEMEAYSGVIEPDCRDYLFEIVKEHKNYYTLDNPCADLILQIWNCDHEELCNDTLSTQCWDILDGAERVMVGRSKQ